MADAGARWRLVLGRYSERHLPPLTGADGRMDAALDQLYGRLYQGRSVRPDGDRGAGLEASAPYLVSWLDTIHELFPLDVCQQIEHDALHRFGLSELLTDPRALERVQPSEELVPLLLALKRQIPPQARDLVRRIIQQVVDEVTRRIRPEVQAAITGRVDRQRRTRRPTGVVDPVRTIEGNLHTWDAERQRLLIEQVTFHHRSRLRHRWDVILCVDQSGSMAGSVINSAVMAGILAGLPGVNVRVVVFDTAVVDLSHLIDDPVEMLLSVQLGGGTDIARALRYCEQLVENPTRTVVALITDFCEGGSVVDLVATARRLREARVTTIGLAALEDGGGHPAFDRRTAERLATTGMEIAALSPSQFAQWLAGVLG